MGKRGKRADHQGDESNQESDYTILSDNEDLYSYLKSDERELEALSAKEENTGKEFVYSDADDDNEISEDELQGSFSRNDRDYTDYEMEDEDELFDIDMEADDQEEQEEQESEPSRSAQITPDGTIASNRFPLSSPPSVGGKPAGASRKGPLKCRFTNCNESFVHKTALIVHERTHTGEKIYTCNYPDCNKQFHQRSYLKYHEQTHLTNSVFKCDVQGCTKQYRSRYTLISHKREHTGEKPFVCDVAGCGKAFSQRYQWISHKKLHESNEADSEKDKGDKSGCESDPSKRVIHSETTDEIMEKQGSGVVKIEEEEEEEVNLLKRSLQQNVEENGEKRKRFRRKCDWIKCDYPGCRKKFRYPKILRKHLLSHPSHPSHPKVKEECTSPTTEDPKRATTMLLKTESISEFEVTKFVSKNSSAENDGSTHFGNVNRVEGVTNGRSEVSAEARHMPNLTQTDELTADEKNLEEKINLTRVEKPFEGRELKCSENWISLDDDDEEIIDAPSRAVEVPDYFV